MIKYLKFNTDCWFALLYIVLLFFLEILKKKKKKKEKRSENDQLTGHFQSFFIDFFRPPTLNLKINSRKSTNKKILALRTDHENVAHGLTLTLFCMEKISV